MFRQNHKLILLILFTGSLCGSASVAERFALDSLNDLGVTVKKTKGTGSEKFEFLNTKSKHTIINEYNSDHQMISFEVKNELGMSLEKTRFLPNRIWKQTPIRLDEWITIYGNSGIHRYTELTGKKRVIEYPFEQSLESVCTEQKNNSLKQVEDVINDLDPELSVRVGNAKVKTSGCETYANGELGLIKDLQSALKAGTKCLLGKSMEALQSKETSDQGLALRAIFENPETTINLVCAKNGETVPAGDQEVKIKPEILAKSWIPPKKGAPGIFINLDATSSKSSQEKKAILFHEMLHWLGVIHSENFDTPYIASQCCLSNDGDSIAAQKACDLLNLSPRPEVDSKEYLNAFTDVMVLQGNAFIPQRAIQRSIDRKLKESTIDLSDQYGANLKLKKLGYTPADVLEYTLKKLDPKLKELANETPTTEVSKNAYQQSVEITGNFLVAQYRSKSSMEDQVKDFAKLKSDYQEVLSKAATVEERNKITSNIHMWLTVFSTQSVRYGNSEEQNEKLANLWLDVDKSF